VTRPGALGFLVEWIDEEYQARIIAAADEVAQKHDRHLVCFVGGALGSLRHRRNAVFDLVSRDQIDGLLLMGTIGNVVGPAGLAEFAARFRPIPLCSVGVALGGMPSVLVDNVRGMRALLLHLLDVHGLRRLAFIRGPEGSEEAAARFAVYQEVLNERGIPLDPALIAPGEFVHASGRDAVRILVDERHLEFDAVVASNDTMTFGAIEALAARGIRTPQDVAVVGFDDVAAARFFSPPLTTVRQPLRDQGLIAAEQLMALIRGEPPPARTVLRTQLVARQSCGCAAPTAPSVAQYQPLPLGRSLRETLRQQRQRISSDLAQAMRAAGGTFELGWGDRLVEALDAELGGALPGTFLATLEELLETVSTLGGGVGSWHVVVSLLRHHCRSAAELDPGAFYRSEEIWQDARVAVSSAAERSHARARLRTTEWVTRQQELSERLNATPSSAGRIELLNRALPELGLRSGYVVVFEAGQAGTGRVLVAFDTFGAAHLPRVGTRFDVSELVPGGLARLPRRTSYSMQPLFGADLCLGYVLLELGRVDAPLHEAARREVEFALESGSTPEKSAPPVGELRTFLVPARLNVEGFRAAVFTGKSHSGSGDYCEVLPIEGGCWVALGQVLPATGDAPGVTLMIQGAVAALVARNPGIMPRELLGAVNAVLFENLRRRLQSELYAELVVIRCDPGGRMVFAGVGAPLLVCRSHDGRTVALPPTGAAVGAVHDVSRSLEDVHCQLEPGDVLLVHTPSVTEASNAEGRPFGLPRLVSELEQVRSSPVEEIRDHLAEALIDWLGGELPNASWVVLRHGWEPPPRSRPGFG
jgi:sigma-B regulation protein RsbU (phosphoserine phosphatase)